MKILGLCHDVLICSAALIDDDGVVFAAAEERYDRVKQSRGFPVKAIEACLTAGGIGWQDLDEVAVAWNPGIDAETAPGGWTTARRWRSEHFAQVPIQLLRHSKSQASPTISLDSLWEDGPKVTYVDHYLSHAGNAVYLSPFSECAVAILDGRGERKTGLLGRARGTEIEVLEEMQFPHSLGLVYGALTQYLGFRPDSDEWKVMALASYADANNEFLEPIRNMIRVRDSGRLEVALEFFEYSNFWDKRMYSDRLIEVLGPVRQANAPLEAKHQQIAAALQQVFEETVAAVLAVLHQRTGLSDVAVSGGCFMNSVYNGKISSTTPFERVFVGSCPDDSGTSVGAALYLHALRTGRRSAKPIEDSYWGAEYSDQECLDACTKYRLSAATVVDDPSTSAAQDLVDGKLIGWFQGRCEFGQRALGNRSILVDARRSDARDIVNSAVKYRESFRPFAPAILAERASDYFETDPHDRVPFMEKVYPFRENVRAEVPSVVHVDGSGRLQTVEEETNPRFRRLIEEMDRQTGVPIVLNTSFNLNGEPIVNSPTDAIRTFYSCGLEVLYLGNVRIAK